MSKQTVEQFVDAMLNVDSAVRTTFIRMITEREDAIRSEGQRTVTRVNTDVQVAPMIQTPEEFWRSLMDSNASEAVDVATIAARDAQIRAEAVEEHRVAVIKEIIEKLDVTQTGSDWITYSQLLELDCLQPAKPPRDKRAMEVAHSIAERFHIQGCDDIADLLAANVREWRGK